MDTVGVLTDSVRCLGCGTTYAKPGMGGTLFQNPGCPLCTYVGWIPAPPLSERRRSASGPLRLRLDPQH